MPETFFRYLSKERDRLDQALARARRASLPDTREVASLQRQRGIVEDQLIRWSNDLADVVTAG